jgi:hypothetical protein
MFGGGGRRGSALLSIRVARNTGGRRLVCLGQVDGLLRFSLRHTGDSSHVQNGTPLFAIHETGRELKTVLIVLNLKKFLRTPIELPPNLTRN